MAFTVRMRLPIIEVDYPAAFSDAEFRALYAKYAEWAVMYPQIAYIVDMRNFDPLFANAVRRKEAGELWREHSPKLIPTTVCEARIVSNNLTRGVLTAFDWLTGSKWPVATFTSPSEAEAWVQRRLRSAIAA